ncbi:MAG: hypothetical protein WDM77_09235 [Steroidobacteraceae bacterium]
MATMHPIHSLCTMLETERLHAVERLAAKNGTPGRDALEELAALQMALMAVREEIETHSIRLGWGDGVAEAASA